MPPVTAPSLPSRRLLLVSQRPLEYGGGGSVRWQYLRRALPRHGWQVTTVSARSNPTSNEASTDPRAARLASGRARVMERAGAVLGPLTRSVGVQPEALAPNGLWSLTGRAAIRAALEQAEPDVVLATCPPQSALFAAASVLAERDVPLVAELRDLWAGNPYFDAGGRLLARIEARAFERCRAVVCVTEGCRARLLDSHPGLKSRVALLPNGFDPRLLALRDPSSGPAPPRATLIHAGTLYGDRTAVALLRALDRPELRDRVRLELLGPIDKATVATIAAVGDRVEIVVEPTTSWEEAIERTRAADIAVVINGTATGGDMALPSKLFEALALGMPVLALTTPGSDTARLLEQLGQQAGCAPPADAEAIARALVRLLEDPPAAVDPQLLRPWDRSLVAEQVAGLLAAVCAA